MNIDRLKKYVNLTQKKEYRKSLIIGGSILLGIILTVVLTISLIKSSFEYNMLTMSNNFSVKVDSVNTYREIQINRLQAGISQDNIRRWNIISAEKVITIINKRLPHDTRIAYATSIVDESTKHRLDLAMVLSVITQESQFNSSAESEKNAHGLMQVIEETGRWICKELGIVYSNKIRFDATENIKMGTWYLRFLLDKYDGNLKASLAHYNGGGYSKNAFFYKSQYINHPEYKRGKVEVDTEYQEFKKRKRNGELLSPEEIVRFKFISKIRCALWLSPETEKYVPEILERTEWFRSILDDPNSLQTVISSDTTEVK